MMAAFIDQTKEVGPPNPLVNLTTQEEFSTLSPKSPALFPLPGMVPLFGVEVGCFSQ
jgi:hypothetical protein